MSGDEDVGEFEIAEGMEIVTEDGDPVGRVVSMLVDEEEDEVAFLLVGRGDGGTPRLLPAEAIVDADEGRLVVALEAGAAEGLPELPEDRDPTEAEIERAYEVAGLL